jgi:hypothetical protein
MRWRIFGGKGRNGEAFVAQAIPPVRFFGALVMGRTAKIGCATRICGAAEKADSSLRSE